MELVPVAIGWLTWLAACGAVVVAVAALARGLDAVLDLDLG